jgi:DNA-binding cell septation regulator SpoVG
MIAVEEISFRLGHRNTAMLAVCHLCLVDGPLRFSVRGIRLVKTDKGVLFVFPSARRQQACLHCPKRNRVDAIYCNFCGGDVSETRIEDRDELTWDTFFPCNAVTRTLIEREIIVAYSKWDRRPEDSLEVRS